MRHLYIIVACALTLVLASCSTVRKTATTVGVNTGVYQYPTVADLEVKDKVEKVMTWGFRPFHLGEPSLDVAKGNLMAETLKEQDADVMLEPQFIFSRTSYGERRLTLIGYPAKFKDFRKATPQDIEALKVNVKPNDRKVYNVAKKKFFGLFD